MIRKCTFRDQAFRDYADHTVITAHTIGGTFTGGWSDPMGISRFAEKENYQIYELDGNTVIKSAKGWPMFYFGHYFMILQGEFFTVEEVS